MSTQGLLASGDAELPTETLRNSGVQVDVVLNNVKDSGNVVVVARRPNGRLEVWSTLVEDAADLLLQRALDLLNEENEEKDEEETGSAGGVK